MEKISKPGRFSMQVSPKNYNSSYISIKVLITIVISISLSACTSINRKPMEISQRETILKSSEVLFSQKELQVQQLNTNGYYPSVGGAAGIIAGGLINAIIVANEQNRVNKAIQPLLHDLKDYNFNNQFQQLLSAQLTEIKWPHLNQKQILKELDEKEKARLINNMQQIGDALIYVKLSHELSSTMESMLVTAEVEIYKKELNKSGLVYKNTFEYVDQLPQPPKSINFLDVWSANHGGKARKSMDTAIKLLSSTIAKDISDPSIKPDSKKPTNVWYTAGRFYGSAYLEAKVGNKSILRTSIGHIIITNNIYVTPKYNWRE